MLIYRNQDHDITFLVRETSEVNHFYIEKKTENPKQITCDIVSDIADLKRMDLIIIAVKYHHLTQLEDQLNSLPQAYPSSVFTKWFITYSFSTRN